MTQEKQLTEQEQQEWVREQYQSATKYLAQKGLITHSVADKESRVLVPILAVWKLTMTDNSQYWVICGDLPTDYSNIGVAPNAREAIRHFALKWQMQAENLLRANEQDQSQFAQLLISRAEGLYQLYEREDVWNTDN